jgi:hypothetical protein
MKEKNLLKIQPLPKVLRMQAIRLKQLRNIHICYIHRRVLSGVVMAPLRMRPLREMSQGQRLRLSAGAMCRKKALLTPIAEVPSALRVMPFATFTAAPILALLCAQTDIKINLS